MSSEKKEQVYVGDETPFKDTMLKKHTADNCWWQSCWGLCKRTHKCQTLILVAGVPGSWVAYSKQAWALAGLCASRAQTFSLMQIQGSCLKALAKPPPSLTPSKLFTPTENSLRLCAIPRVKSSFSLRDIGSQSPWREQQHSLQSQNLLPDPHCFASNVNENAVKSTPARGLDLFSN